MKLLPKMKKLYEIQINFWDGNNVTKLLPQHKLILPKKNLKNGGKSEQKKKKKVEQYFSPLTRKQ